MADEEEKVENEEKEPEEKESLQEKLAKLEEKVDAGKDLARLMSDPQVREIIEARREGKMVRVVPLEEEEEKQEEDSPEEEDVDLEGMTTEEVAKFLSKRILKSVEGVIEKRVNPLKEELNYMKTYVQTSEQRNLRKQIEEVRKEFPDFDAYREDMIQLSKENPSLKVRELYVLAKVRRGDPLVTSDKIESEKPTSSSARPAQRRQRTKALPPGRKGFRELLQEATKEVILGE